MIEASVLKLVHEAIASTADQDAIFVAKYAEFAALDIEVKKYFRTMATKA